MPANDDLIHGWVSTDCGRDTSDILWSCLATIFLSVWTAVHLPVPLYRGQRPLSTRQKLVGSRIGPALISIIAPEYLAITALGELTGSWLRKRKIKQLSRIDWTVAHQFFLDMGGVCLRSTSGRYRQIGAEEVIKAIEASCSNGRHTEDLPDWVSEIKKLTEDQITDLAKSDTLSKLVACGQALWLVTQVVSRLCQNQAVTLLEVSTCAYVSCALLSYAAWWKKPQGCSPPILLSCSDEEISKVKDPSYPHYYILNETWGGRVGAFCWAGRDWFTSIEYTEVGSTRNYYFFVGQIGLFPTIFGAIHVGSWNVRLPSDVELRASSIYCLTIGFTLAVAVLILRKDWAIGFFRLFVLASAILYIIVRVFMIVEIFLSLRALPPSAYDSVQWSSYIPHI